jgi:serine/threonine protein kinase/Tol biopolymer transport system component
MSPERLKQIGQLQAAARQKQGAERRAFLDSACAGDEALRREVEAVLADERDENTKTLVAAGSQLGPYKLETHLGAGGMGEVFRATDTRLHRTVAIKILPHDKVSDPERKRRFLQEARAASGLNHPNIVTVYDIGSDGDVDYLVMECVPGKSLDKLIPPKGMPLPDALDLAAQTAGALAIAHAAGIVHRDIKPANLMIAAESQVKILDFGLAKLAERPAGLDDETITQQTAVSEPGALLGTAAYMSPEQASGRPVDYRTDIFSLGIVIHEMIGGQRPFRGTSQVDTMHSIIHDPRPLLTVQPPELNEILDKALAKDPKDRYQHAGDLALDLRRLRSAWQARTLPSMTVAAAPTKRRSMALGLLIAGVFSGIAAGWWIGHRAPPPTSLRADASILNLATYSGTERSGAISPDGKFFAFVSDRGGAPNIWVRQVSGGEPLQVTHDAAPKFDLLYASDGESIYYSTAGAQRAIWRVGVLGGTPRKIMEGVRYPALSPDGKRLAMVRAGETLEIANADGTEGHRIVSVRNLQYPQWSPDSRWIAYTAGSLFDTYQLHLVDPEGQHPRRLTSFAAGFIFCISWLPDSRHLVFSHNTLSPDAADLLSVSIDSSEIGRLTLFPRGVFSSCSVSGNGTRLVGTIDEQDWEIWKAPLGGDPKANAEAAVRLLDRTWQPMWTQVPRAGVLLFNSPATGIRNLWTMPLAAAGAPRQVTFFPAANVTHAALSADGSRVAYVSGESGNGQIWISNSDSSGARQLTHNDATNFWPFWSPDGEWVAFGSQQPGAAVVEIWKVPASGGLPAQVTHGGGFRGDWSPDGGRIVYDKEVLQGSVRENASNATMEIADAATGKALQKVAESNLGSPVWSPDGKRISATQGNAVWIIDPETGEGRKAIQFAPDFIPLFRAAWTQDGKSVIVNRRQRASHIVLLENFWAR